MLELLGTLHMWILSHSITSALDMSVERSVTRGKQSSKT